MRKLVGVCALMLFFGAYSQAQSEADFERVNEEAFEAFDNYNYRTAIDKEHVLLKWLKKPKLKNDTNEVIIYLNLGGFYQSYQNYDSAHTCLEKSRALCEKHLGKDNEYYINIVLQLGGFYEAIELLPEAETINEEAIDLIAKGATNDPWLIGAIYSNQAIVKKKLFKLKEGIVLEEKSERLTERSSGRRSLDYANLLNTKALLYGYMGEIKKQEKLLLEAMEICSDLNATNKSLYSTVLNNMATLVSERGDYKSAIRYYETSYQIKAGIYTEKSLECALVQSNEGIALANAGQYEKGIKMMLSSRRTVEDLLGKFHPEWFERCLNLGVLYDKAGMYEEADQLYDQVLVQAERELGVRSGVYLSILNNAAEYSTRRNEFDKSSRYYDILIKNLDVMSENYQLTIQGNYANFLNNTGRWELAEPLYKKVMDGWEELMTTSSQEYLLAKHNFAVYYLDLKQYAKAKELFLETETTLRQVAGPKTPLILTLQEHLAAIYSQEKEYDKALRLYQNLLDVREEEYGKESIDNADLLGKISMCYTNLDQPEKGRELMEQAYFMKVKLLGKDDPSLSYETSLLATSYTYSGDYKKGVMYYQEAKRLTARQFATYFRFMTEQEKLNFLGSKMSELKQLQAIAVDNVKQYPAFADLAFEVELMMKGMVLESGNQIKKEIKRKNDPDLNAHYAKWQDMRAQLAVELIKPLVNRRPDFADLEAKAIQEEKEILKALNLEEPVIEMDWKEIQSQLKKGEALVEYISYKSFIKEENRVAALLLKPGMAHPQLIELYAEKDLGNYLASKKKTSDEGMVTSLYGEKRGVSDIDEDFIPDLSDDSLYAYVWHPLEDALAGSTTVYYSPSGSVHKVAVAALRDTSGKYLSERYALHTLSSARKLKEKQKLPKFDEIFLIGGVNYDKLPGLNGTKNPNEGPAVVIRGGNGARAWSYLPGTKEEVTEIAGLVKKGNWQVTLQTDQMAFEEGVKTTMQQGASILHISTHGYFFPAGADAPGERPSMYQVADNPLLRSGLLLSGANVSWTGQQLPEGRDDGVLTAFEVSTMDLSGTGLAVLSACQTGLGDIEGSEGVFGLQRAFKQAGVEYVMMSLWQVPDKETVEFMSQFYSKLAEGMKVEEAFNAAQAIMRDKYDPYYWAAFVLVR